MYQLKLGLRFQNFRVNRVHVIILYICFEFSQKLVYSNTILKVTVQFETEGNSQNEIVSHMDRLEVKR